MFGQLVGEAVPVVPASDTKNSSGAAAEGDDQAEDSSSGGGGGDGGSGGGGLRTVPKIELQAHNTEEDCWVAVYGKVYDFTDFLAEHPGGTKATNQLALFA